MYPKLILYNKFLTYNMFINYKLPILCIEYLQMHIHTHTHIVRLHSVRVFVSRNLAFCDFSVCGPDDPL